MTKSFWFAEALQGLDVPCDIDHTRGQLSLMRTRHSLFAIAGERTFILIILLDNAISLILDFI